MAQNATDQVIANKGFNNFDVGGMFFDGAMGAVAGRIGGPGIGGSYVLKDSARLMNKNIVRGVVSGTKNSVKGAVKSYLGRQAVKDFYSEFAPSKLLKRLGIDVVFGVGNECLKYICD